MSSNEIEPTDMVTAIIGSTIASVRIPIAWSCTSFATTTSAPVMAANTTSQAAPARRCRACSPARPALIVAR